MTDLNDVPLTAAEFRILRDLLGLPARWIADEFGNDLRTIQRWDSGNLRVPAGAALDMGKLLAYTDDFVETLASTLAEADPQNRVVVAFLDDETYRRHHPDLKMPASWHRQAVGQAAALVPGTRVRYVHELVDDE